MRRAHRVRGFGRASRGAVAGRGFDGWEASAHHVRHHRPEWGALHKYCLRSVYPYAHQIVVVEGASPGGASIATADGHSSDGTLAALRRFKSDEDPDDKVIIVTAEDEGHDDGFWPGEKDEQSRVYAARATGDYLWQVDIDEFYRDVDMQTVLDVLSNDGVTAMSFKMVTFWGDPGYRVDGWTLRRGADYYHRLFKWGPGYTYISHRPPTVCDERGVDLRDRRWLDARATSALGVRLFHYSLLFPKQVREKGEYYKNAAHSPQGLCGLGQMDGAVLPHDCETVPGPQSAQAS